MTVKYEFDAADGTHVELDCDDRFLELVRSRLGISSNELIQTEDIKHIFIESLKGITEA